MKRIIIVLLCFINIQVYAQTLRIAVAANAQFVIKTLQADFKQKTGIVTEVVIGSSGKLTAQIKNGAPYDFFLSADMEFPENLFKSGQGLTKPKEYAAGSLIVCSTSQNVKNWKSLVASNTIHKIAIGNPSLAPYGLAAEQALKHDQLWEKVKSKLVFAESISQVNIYLTTGNVALGFTSESLIYEYKGKNKLNWFRIDPSTYDRIRQGMIVLSYAKKGNFAKAMKFYNYLSSASAQKILQNNGYQVPKS